MTHPTGKLTRTGFLVMETYDVHLDVPSDQKAALEADLEKYIRQFLLAHGQTVNAVQIMQYEGPHTPTQAARKVRRDHWFHIVYPENERSGWLCA